MENEEKKFIRVGNIFFKESNTIIDTYIGDKKVYNFYTNSPYIIVDSALSKYKIVPIDGIETCILTTTNIEDSEEITAEKYSKLFEASINYYLELLNDNTV